MFYFDPLFFIIVLPAMILALWAQMKVKGNFRKYSKIRVSSGLTGAQAARKILRQNGIDDVSIEQARGWLSDHYSPTEKVLRLSEQVYQSNSIAAIGVAAHEAGHAVQHAKGYAIMHLWQIMAKPAAFMSNAAIWIIIIGFFMGALGLAKIGFWMFAFVVVFQIITLPVEFDASRRAKQLIGEYGIASPADRDGVAAVLNSAAMTYVAAAAASLSQLLYYAIRLRSR